MADRLPKSTQTNKAHTGKRPRKSKTSKARAPNIITSNAKSKMRLYIGAE